MSDIGAQMESVEDRKGREFRLRAMDEIIQQINTKGEMRKLAESYQPPFVMQMLQSLFDPAQWNNAMGHIAEEAQMIGNAGRTGNFTVESPNYPGIPTRETYQVPNLLRLLMLDTAGFARKPPGEV